LSCRSHFINTLKYLTGRKRYGQVIEFTSTLVNEPGFCIHEAYKLEMKTRK